MAQETLNDELFEAAVYGDIGKAKEALAAGAGINATDKYGRTAVILACMHGHTDIAGLFIEYGADINTTGNCDSTALAMACWNGHTDIVRLLINTVL